MMTQTLPATCVLGPGKTGLAIGYRILDLDGAIYAAFSTTGVSETSTAGTYRKAGGVVAPLAGGYIVWGTASVDLAEDGIPPAIGYSGDVTLETLSEQLDSGFAAISVPSAATIAAAVWDETISAHRIPGSAGVTVADRNGTVDDTWVEAATDDGALADMYGDHADDASSEYTSVYSPIVEFDGSLWVGIGSIPAGGASAVIARLDRDTMALSYDHVLPEEGIARLLATDDGMYLVALGADERVNTGVSAIYLRDRAGNWTEKRTLPGMNVHVMTGFFVGDRLYVGGASINQVAWSDDLGDTWTYGFAAPGDTRVTGLCANGTQFLATVRDFGTSRSSVWRSTDSGATFVEIYNPDPNMSNMTSFVVWRGVFVSAWRDNLLVVVDGSGVVTEHYVPFLVNSGNARFNNNAVWWDGNEEWLYVLGQSAVWRTNNIRDWQRIWLIGDDRDLGDSLYSEMCSMSLAGDDLFVATRGAHGQVLRRPADPVLAGQRIARNAMTLAPSIGASEAGSIDAKIDSALAALGEAGGVPFTYFVEANGAPCANAKVIVTTDQEGQHKYAVKHTNEFGNAYFHLSHGTYYFWTYKQGYEVSVADIEIVS